MECMILAWERALDLWDETLWRVPCSRTTQLILLATEWSTEIAEPSSTWWDTYGNGHTDVGTPPYLVLIALSQKFYTLHALVKHLLQFQLPYISVSTSILGFQRGVRPLQSDGLALFQRHYRHRDVAQRGSLSRFSHIHFVWCIQTLHLASG